MTRRHRPHRLLGALLATLVVGSGSLGAATAIPNGQPAAEASALAPGAVAHFIVVLRPGADPAAAATRARRDGVRVERTFRNALGAYTASMDGDQLRRAAADPAVASIVPDQPIDGEDVLAAQVVPTGVSRISGRLSPAVLATGAGGRVDADVAIFDTGIDPAHPDLVVAGGYNCTSPDATDWIDQAGHGTHVAGTVGALDNGEGVVGVAPGVRLWAVRVLDATSHGTLSGWLCGLDWIASQDDPSDPARPLIEAVNMSVARFGSDDGSCGTVDGDLLHQAICRVVGLGITVVAAAGNDSNAVGLRVPAAYGEVIAVSALADTDGRPGGSGDDRCFAFGAYQVDDTFGRFSNSGPEIDLIAPGACILSTTLGGTYGSLSGTSMAAAHVTGAAALYRATRPDAPPAEVRWALQYLGTLDWTTATDPDGTPDILLDVSQIGPLGDFAPAAKLPAGGLLAGRAGANWTFPIAAGRGPGFIEPIAFAVTAAPAQLSVTLVGPTTLSATSGDARLSVAVPPTTPAGTYEIVVVAAYHATRVHEIRLTVFVDTEPPVATAPVAALVRGSRATATGVPLRLSWGPATDQSPIARYQLGEVAGADWAAAPDPTAVSSTAGTVRSAIRTVPFATARAWSVCATDRAGNVGPWATAASVVVSVAQESNTAVRRSTGWKGAASSYALGGRDAWATRAGAWMRYTFTGRGIALVGPKGPSRGRAEVRLDGVLVATVDEYAKASGSRWVLHATAVDPGRRHTIEVRVLGTAGRPRFDVDAFLVLR